MMGVDEHELKIDLNSPKLILSGNMQPTVNCKGAGRSKASFLTNSEKPRSSMPPRVETSALISTTVVPSICEPISIEELLAESTKTRKPLIVTGPFLDT